MLINQPEDVCSYLNISGCHRYSNVQTNTWRGSEAGGERRHRHFCRET